MVDVEEGAEEMRLTTSEPVSVLSGISFCTVYGDIFVCVFKLGNTSPSTKHLTRNLSLY